MCDVSEPEGLVQETKEATNYYFCYRWLLILFKREFSSYEEVRHSANCSVCHASETLGNIACTCIARC